MKRLLLPPPAFLSFVPLLLFPSSTPSPLPIFTSLLPVYSVSVIFFLFWSLLYSFFPPLLFVPFPLASRHPFYPAFPVLALRSVLGTQGGPGRGRDGAKCHCQCVRSTLFSMCPWDTAQVSGALQRARACWEPSHAASALCCFPTCFSPRPRVRELFCLRLWVHPALSPYCPELD